MSRRSNAAQSKSTKRGGNPAQVKSVLKSAFRRFGIDEKLQSYQFVLVWKEIVGVDIARRTRPECIERGTLIVRVCDSAWAQELSFRKEMLIGRMAEHLPDADITDIRFYVDGQRYNRQ
jgi:predicted nucleic acid-binding Zn ribbon protein